MSKRILITGGAGFIGSHVADELLLHGYHVRALDSLIAQVHGPERKRPAYLAAEVDLMVGDVRDPRAVDQALRDVDAVYHFAAAVGVGQSMYQIEDYTSVNDLGTAVLLEAMSKRPVERLVVASSMSIYGEGLYRDAKANVQEGRERELDQLKTHDWEVRGIGGEALQPVATPESKAPALPSVYAIGKYTQERLCLTVGRAYGIPSVALRFFNAYGPRQSLSNPYTGVLAIFASRFMNGQPPLINEDGLQRRDFVNVADVAQACRLALEAPQAEGRVFNVGSGGNHTVREIALQMSQVLGCSRIQPQITGKYRTGDIRNCFADIGLAQRVLGYRPRVSLAEGLQELAEWLENQDAVDRADEAAKELDARRLTV